MAANIAGVSTLGITFGYGTEDTAGTKPTTFTQLNRINAIGGITIENEQIDASALEDKVSRYVQGRGDTGGSFTVTVNVTNETTEQWQNVITAYNALTGAKRMWFEVWSPNLTKAFYIVAQPPQKLPMPESSQNGLWTMEIPLTIEEYVGLDVAIKPTEG